MVLGMGIMGDGIELLVIAFILPGAERELCMDERMKGWLGMYSICVKSWESFISVDCTVTRMITHDHCTIANSVNDHYRNRAT